MASIDKYAHELQRSELNDRLRCAILYRELGCGKEVYYECSRNDKTWVQYV